MSSSTATSQSVESKILAAIRKRGRGTVFVPSDFLKLGSREAIDTTLHRLTRTGVIRRLARGLYDYPKEHPVLGPLQPTADTVAQALAGRDCTRLQPAGAYAANALGLSEQVPAEAVFLTDGPARTVKIGSTTIQLRQAALQRNLSPVVMEKDFWVCCLLGILFETEIGASLVFKGGTSLSNQRLHGSGSRTASIR
jgi:hypothetical protein